MKQIFMIIFIAFIFFGCAKKVQTPSVISLDTTMQTQLIEDDFSALGSWGDEDYTEVLSLFRENCKIKKVQKIYKETCQRAQEQSDAKEFLHKEFLPYRVVENKKQTQEGLLTGYYEPFLKGSLTQDERYIYPIYKQPKDLITVELSKIYPELKNYRLRGRLEGNRLVPYYNRAQSKEQGLDAEVLCYTDSQLDRFFLEIQGSGKVILDNNSSMYVGFANQNGHKYRAIGRYLVKINALRLEDVSLQSIKAWLEANPSRVDEVLNYNDSMVFFQKREQGATGSLGVELIAGRSVAVDRRYIPLGSMLYLKADSELQEFNRIVFAHDTGGAIKGAIRADLFLGSGEEALEIAGRLKAPLQLWILLPKERRDRDI